LLITMDKAVAVGKDWRYHAAGDLSVDRDHDYGRARSY